MPWARHRPDAATLLTVRLHRIQGAQARDILGMIVGDGLVLALVGIAIGALLAYGAAIGMESLLAGVRPGDVATFGAAITLCLLMTLVGSLIPAVRAVRIDAAAAVRPE